MEHRWGERIKVDIPVQINVHPFPLRVARLKNVSLSGASIRADYELRPLAKVDVILSIPLNPGAERSSVAACVMRCNGYGIGLEWCEYAPDIINELMQSLNPQRVGRLRTSERPNRRLEALFLKHDG